MSGSTVTRTMAALLAVLAACDRADVIAPPPTRSVDDSTRPPPSLAPSSVDAIVGLDLESALEALDAALPERFGDLDRRVPLPGNDRAHYAFEVRRGRLGAQFRGDAVRLSTVLRYRGRGWFDPPLTPEVEGSCGTEETPLRARVVVTLNPRLRPDWTLEAHPRLTRLEPLTAGIRDRCEVTFLKIDMTEKVLEAARAAATNALPLLDRSLAKLDVRGLFDDVWREIQQPIQVADSIWLMIRPSAVRVGPIHLAEGKVATTVGITARPTIESGTRPARGTLPLPAIGPLDSVAGFSVRVMGRFSYPAISALLDEQLAGREVTVADRLVEVTQVAAFAVGGGRLALGVRFRGSARGLIYFVGRPEYDPAADRISVPDLDFDVGSADLLVHGLTWLRGAELREFLRSAAAFPSAKALDPLTQLAMEGMNRELTPGVALEVKLTDTEVIRIDPRADALFVVARARGTARLELPRALFR